MGNVELAAWEKVVGNLEFGYHSVYEARGRD